MKIKLNCDIGESFGVWKIGNDSEIFPLIDMANLACGFHAGDPLTMKKSLDLAVKSNVEIGAHIAYQDLVGFGRRSMECSSDEIEAIALYQIGALDAFCKIHTTHVSYVKPHGALYNDMMRDELIYVAIVKAISTYSPAIKLMILSTCKNSMYETIADAYGVELIYEVFADRNYTKEGYLVPRKEKNALIKDEKTLLQRVEKLKTQGIIEALDATPLHLKADCICVHGETSQALAFIKILQKTLN